MGRTNYEFILENGMHQKLLWDFKKKKKSYNIGQMTRSSYSQRKKRESAEELTLAMRQNME